MNKVLSIAHSMVFHRSISTMFSSNKISQHNLNRPYTIHHTYHTDPACTAHGIHAQLLHTSKTDRICHAQYSKYIVHCSHPQHNPILMHINMHSQPALPTTLPSTTLCMHTTNKYTKHICVSGSKKAQDVGMV